MKTYRITLAKKFPVGSDSKGELTHFKTRYLNGIKIHTIRDNIKHWQDVEKEVNSGQAILSVRQWKGRPYHSIQREIGRLKRISTQIIEVETFAKPKLGLDVISQIDGGPYDGGIRAISKNDGFSHVSQLLDWLKLTEPGSTYKGIIIHFTDFKYK